MLLLLSLMFVSTDPERDSVNPSQSCTSTTKSETCPSGCECSQCKAVHPKPVSIQTGLPYLDTHGLGEAQRNCLIGRLLEDSREMMSAFQNLINRTCKTLKQLEVTPEDLVTTVMGLGALDPVLHSVNTPLFHERQEKLMDAPNII